MVIFELAFSITIGILTNRATNTYVQRNQLLKDLDNAVYGCSDIYMDIPEAVIKDQISEPHASFITAMSLLKVFALLVLVKITFTMIMGLWVRCRYKEASNN